MAPKVFGIDDNKVVSNNSSKVEKIVQNLLSLLLYYILIIRELINRIIKKLDSNNNYGQGKWDW